MMNYAIKEGCWIWIVNRGFGFTTHVGMLKINPIPHCVNTDSLYRKTNKLLTWSDGYNHHMSSVTRVNNTDEGTDLSSRTSWRLPSYLAFLTAVLVSGFTRIRLSSKLWNFFLKNNRRILNKNYHSEKMSSQKIPIGFFLHIFSGVLIQSTR